MYTKLLVIILLTAFLTTNTYLNAQDDVQLETNLIVTGSNLINLESERYWISTQSTNMSTSNTIYYHTNSQSQNNGSKTVSFFYRVRAIRAY